MRSRCAICGRPTEPAVMIGSEAVGPRCARKAGLYAVAATKGSRVRHVGRRTRAPKERLPETIDMFEGLEP